MYSYSFILNPVYHIIKNMLMRKILNIVIDFIGVIRYNQIIKMIININIEM